MIDDPWKIIRDILVASPEVTKVIPTTNIRNKTISDTLLTQPPYIRINILDMEDVVFGDGQVRAGRILYQIDIWQKSPSLALGNTIKKLLKNNGIYFVESREMDEEKINSTLSLHRDSRRYSYSYELEENEIY